MCKIGITVLARLVAPGVNFYLQHDDPASIRAPAFILRVKIVSQGTNDILIIQVIYDEKSESHKNDLIPEP